MRGSLYANLLALLAPGIIPAHAGLTRRPSGRMISTRDHPRACGAHTVVKAVEGMEWGSSPRMRGSLIEWLLKNKEKGIIPAHAGLT